MQTVTPSRHDVGAPPRVVELAERTGDGLQVVLYWDRLTGRLWVDVINRDGVTMVVDAPPDRALDVFYHPFAYRDVVAEDLFAAV
jgi:hypothetical protein